MKQFLSLILLLSCLFVFTGCNSKKQYEKGWHTGYDAGVEYGAGQGYHDGYGEGYPEGYDAGFSDAIHEAEDYASKNSAWHPEEALAIVDAYSKKEPLLDGRVPSKTEYQEAVETLRLFYEYFYGMHFKTK